MRRVLLLPLVVLAAGCGSGSAEPPVTGVLSVKTVLDTSSGAYIEGFVWQLDALSLDGGTGYSKPPRDDAVLVDLPPGAYRLDSAVRPCDGTCKTLDNPTDECSTTVQIVVGKTTERFVQIAAGEPCEFGTAETFPVPLGTGS